MSIERETPAEALDGLISALRLLLEVVDSSSSEDQALLVSWNQCQEMLLNFRAKSASIVDQTELEKAEMQDQLQTAVRLNAIATHLVQREAERIAAELDTLRDAKQKLRSQISRSSESGGSVDLAG